MKPMMTAFAATIVLAIGASLILSEFGFSAADAHSGDSVRLD